MKIGIYILNGRKFGTCLRPSILRWLGFGRVLKIFAVSLASVPIVLSAQIVSNLDEVTAGAHSILNTQWLANQFTTGSNAGGYTLASATGGFIAANGTPTNFQAQIFSDNSNSPENSLENLSGANPTTAGNHTFNSAGLNLSANTSYWLIFSATDSSPNRFRWEVTNSSAETSSDGWTIRDGLTLSGNQGTSWEVDIVSGSDIPQFSIQATPVPEPHEYAMFVGLGLVGFVAARRHLVSKALA